ncbi:LysM peptidoglycan-binding domain-containing protein [Yimella sp. NH-Cas1]|nr:LysM peptidoglycan-binding domain-containing protein [Yimella sp. NH-Cas1]
MKSGDTLGKIAEKLGLNNWKSLFHLNNDKISNPNLIFVGQVFDIPAN